jgi:hypothetical protein
MTMRPDRISSIACSIDSFGIVVTLSPKKLFLKIFIDLNISRILSEPNEVRRVL